MKKTWIFMISQALGRLLSRPSVPAGRYAAPEVCQTTDYGPPADIYSFGFFFYEIVSRRVPSAREPCANKQSCGAVMYIFLFFTCRL